MRLGERKLLLGTGGRAALGYGRGRSLRIAQIRDPARALRRVTREHFHAVALELPPRMALPLVRTLRRLRPNLVIIILTPPGGGKGAKASAVRSGVDAVVVGTPHPAGRRRLLETALETLRLAALNRKLALEAWKTARSLMEAVRLSRSARSVRGFARTEALSGLLPPSDRPSPR